MGLFERCKLEGRELDAKVSELEGFSVGIASVASYSTDWQHGGPILERDQIFLKPPHEAHVCGGPNAGWHQEYFWTATVSSRTRTRPNPNDSELPPTVGRGAGPTPLIAAMRAYVDSRSD